MLPWSLFTKQIISEFYNQFYANESRRVVSPAAKRIAFIGSPRTLSPDTLGIKCFSECIRLPIRKSGRHAGTIVNRGLFTFNFMPFFRVVSHSSIVEQIRLIEMCVCAFSLDVKLNDETKNTVFSEMYSLENHVTVFNANCKNPVFTCTFHAKRWKRNSRLSF